MARFIRDLELNKPTEFVTFVMNDYLTKNKFKPYNYKGEEVFRAGDALLEGFKYIKWAYDGSNFHFEAWMQGSFGGEMDLEGFAGALQKKPFKESILAQFDVLLQELPNGGLDANGQPVPIPVQTTDNTKAAGSALALGIVTFILGFISPIFCIVCGVLCFNQARMGSGSSKAGLAKTGKVFAIIGVVITIILWILNMAMQFA